MRTIFVTINPSNDQLVCKQPMLRQLYAGLALIVLGVTFFSNAAGTGNGNARVMLIITLFLGILLSLTFTTRILVLSKTGVSFFYLRRLMGGKRHVSQFNSSSVTSVSLKKRTRLVLNLMSFPAARDTNLTENTLVLQMSDNSSIRFAVSNTKPKKTPLDDGAKQVADFLGVPLTTA